MSKSNKSVESTGKLIVIVVTLLLIFLFALVLIYFSTSPLVSSNESRKNIWDRVSVKLGENSFLLGKGLVNNIIVKDFVEVATPDLNIFTACNEKDNKLACNLVPLKQKGNFDKEIFLHLFADWTEDNFFERATSTKANLIDTTNPEVLDIYVNSETKKVNGYGITGDYLNAIEFCYDPYKICGSAFLKNKEDINDYGYKKFMKNLREMLKGINITKSTGTQVEDYQKLYNNQ